MHGLHNRRCKTTTKMSKIDPAHTLVHILDAQLNSFIPMWGQEFTDLYSLARSAHFGARFPVMCDGAVKSFSFKIEASDVVRRPEDLTAPLNQTLFNRLGTRNDGLPGEPQ